MVKPSLLLGVAAVLNGLLIGPLMTAHLRLYFDYLKKGLGVWYVNIFNKIFLAIGMFICDWILHICPV